VVYRGGVGGGVSTGWGDPPPKPSIYPCFPPRNPEFRPVQPPSGESSDFEGLPAWLGQGGWAGSWGGRGRRGGAGGAPRGAAAAPPELASGLPILAETPILLLSWDSWETGRICCFLAKRLFLPESAPGRPNGVPGRVPWREEGSGLSWQPGGSLTLPKSGSCQETSESWSQPPIWQILPGIARSASQVPELAPQTWVGTPKQACTQKSEKKGGDAHLVRFKVGLWSSSRATPG
jgi:hypothetical protein